MRYRTLLGMSVGLLAGLCSLAATYKAHDPAWRGIWIWQRVNRGADTALVDMRQFIEASPGAWGDSLVNRIAGNAMTGGVDRFFIRIADRKGNLLYPAADRDRVLRFDNWGVDFSEFDYPAAWMKLAERTGVTVTFTGSPADLEAFRLRYPSARTATIDQEPQRAFRGALINSDRLSARNLVQAPLEFKRDFELSSPVRKAQLCLTAVGVYELKVNGRLVGRDGDWNRGETYDITPLLKPGRNQIEITVFPEKMFQGLLVNTNLELNDGSVLQIDSDQEFLVRRSGSAQWQRPDVVGFEGAGPRFRLREPFIYHRELIPANLEAVVTPDCCRDLPEKGCALLEGEGNLQLKQTQTLFFQFKSPELIREIRVRGEFSSLGCEVFGRRPDGVFELLTAPVSAGRTIRGPFNLAFAPMEVDAVKLVLTPGTSGPAVVKQIQFVKSEEK